MGSNKMGIGSPIPPLREVVGATVYGCVYSSSGFLLAMRRLVSVLVRMCVVLNTEKVENTAKENCGSREHIKSDSLGRGR